MIATVHVLVCGLAFVAAEGVEIGAQAPDLRLTHVNGAPADWDKLAGSKATVLAFLGNDCPLVKLYAPRLTRLAERFAADGVRFVGVNANYQDSPEQIETFRREFEISFPILRDVDQKAADAIGARRTPEIFVLDADGVLRYRGRIDDQYQVGLYKARLGREDLAEAIRELLAGEPVSQPELPATGCLIGRAPSQSTGQVTFSKHVAPIFQNHCVECHREGEIGPFAMTSYQDVAGWGETILEAVSSARMPPWFANPEFGHFANDSRLSAEEKDVIAAWVAGGCPEGDPRDLPEPRTFVEGWNIPEPHLILKMSDRPFHVPAEGVVSYKHFVIDPEFKEDKWVVASEARPGNRSVVHHILVFVQAPGEPVELMRGSLLAAYAPGMPPRMLPAGMAKRIPAGSRIVLQIHYTANGKPQEDVSSLGLVFCDEADVVQRVESGWAVNFLFGIPPRAADHKVYAVYRFTADRLLFNLTPHMHMRGKSFRYEAWYPDGRKEVLLDVPKYDFNWQIEYEFVEPKPMPKGTELRCYAAFDNSPENPTNPDPDRWVRFGQQTWDEMMIGWFVAATPPGQAK